MESVKGIFVAGDLRGVFEFEKEATAGSTGSKRNHLQCADLHKHRAKLKGNDEEELEEGAFVEERWKKNHNRSG